MAAEIRGLDLGTSFDGDWVETKLSRLMETLGQIMDRSVDEGRPTDVIANEMARERLKS